MSNSPLLQGVPGMETTCPCNAAPPVSCSHCLPMRPDAHTHATKLDCRGAPTLLGNHGEACNALASTWVTQRACRTISQVRERGWKMRLCAGSGSFLHTTPSCSIVTLLQCHSVPCVARANGCRSAEAPEAGRAMLTDTPACRVCFSVPFGGCHTARCTGKVLRSPPEDPPRAAHHASTCA